jgi:hypothetical protein
VREIGFMRAIRTGTKPNWKGLTMTEQIVVFEDWERVMKEAVPVALQGPIGRPW